MPPALPGSRELSPGRCSSPGQELCGIVQGGLQPALGTRACGGRAGRPRPRGGREARRGVPALLWAVGRRGSEAGRQAAGVPQCLGSLVTGGTGPKPGSGAGGPRGSRFRAVQEMTGARGGRGERRGAGSPPGPPPARASPPPAPRRLFPASRSQPSSLSSHCSAAWKSVASISALLLEPLRTPGLGCGQSAAWTALLRFTAAGPLWAAHSSLPPHGACAPHTSPRRPGSERRG